MNIPEDLKYTKTHEWARIDGSVVTMGITAYAVEQLGDIVYLELPNDDTEVQKEVAIGTLESVKAASDVYSPVSGKITKTNQDLPDNLDLIKNDTYGAGWIVKIELSDSSEIDSLMDSAAYNDFLNNT